MDRWPNHDPSDVLDYGIDFSALLDEGDSLVDVTWSATPVGLTLGEKSIDAGVASTWIEGGAAGTTYTVTAHATTAGGREYDRSARLFVTER